MSAPITPATTVRRSSDPISAALGDELVMMDAQSGTFYAFDDIARAIWSALETSITVAELIEALGARYDVSPERCEQDVVPFLEHLAEKRLIEIETLAPDHDRGCA